jgi:hypothetical protein
MTTQENKLIQNLVIAGGVYFLVIQPILKKLKVLPEKEVSPVNDPFAGVAFLKAAPIGTKYLLIKQDEVKKLAQIIYDAFNFLGDDEAAVTGVFRKLQTQSQVAYLAQKFNEIYKTDLLTYLKNGKQGLQHTYWSGLNAAELQQIKDLVKVKPKYNV